MARALTVGLLLLGLTACSSSTPAPETPRLWADHAHTLAPGARPFAVGVAESDSIYETDLGSWTEPLDVDAIVIDTSRGGRSDGVEVRTRGWLGVHRLVLGHGTERIVLRYDAPAAPAPVVPGERVHVYAHTMAVGTQLAFVMAVADRRGEPRMIGLQTPEPGAALLPRGWSITFGPEIDREPVCDGAVVERAVRVRGPGGEAVVSPGWTSIAPVGEGGARYAIDVAVAREAEASCLRTDETDQLSVVLRRIAD